MGMQRYELNRNLQIFLRFFIRVPSLCQGWHPLFLCKELVLEQEEIDCSAGDATVSEVEDGTEENFRMGHPWQLVLEEREMRPAEANPTSKNFGELAEWSNAAVLKTVDLNGSGGSNPSLSASWKAGWRKSSGFCVQIGRWKACFLSDLYTNKSGR